MALTRKDALATAFTLFAVLVFAAANESWNVPLVGSSVRWAAVAILVVGVATCALGSAADEMSTERTSGAIRFLAAVGTAALVLAVWALVTGSVIALGLFTGCFVVLWAGATLRHAWHPRHAPRRRLVT